METKLGHNCINCKCFGCSCHTEEDLAGIVKLKPEITYNNNRVSPNGKKAPDGIELRFGATRPTAEGREMLKSHGFRFSEKQTIWYAKDNAKSRELVAYLENNGIEADDTQYEKRNFWAKVGNIDFYRKLSNHTEFMIAETPPRFFWNKKKLESAVNPSEYLFNGKLLFKKFYNKVIGEEEEENEGEESAEQAGEKQKGGGNPQAKGNQDLALKLKTIADAMQSKIDAKINSATSKQRPTAKRLRVAAGMRSEGYYLRNIQLVLYALSEAHRAGVIDQYPLLKDIQTKAQVEILNKYHDVHLRKHEDHYLQSVFSNNKDTFQRLGITSVFSWGVAIAQKEELLGNVNPQSIRKYDERQEKIQEMEIEIKSMNIPGFFPTPKELISELLRWANIQRNNTILEPSAGKGDILDAIKEKFSSSVDLYACEINPTLRKLLDLKGYEVLAEDFLELDQKFDRIIMNPPFENGADVNHVTHALNLLNPGGRLVAIMGEGAFFRKYSRDNTFRQLLADQNAYVSDSIKGAFKNAFNQTGIIVRIVVINKDGTFPEPKDDNSNQDEHASEPHKDDDELETLELEAQAELEIMKMRLDLEKKQKGLSGLVGNNKDKLNELRQIAKDFGDYPDVWNFK